MAHRRKSKPQALKRLDPSSKERLRGQFAELVASGIAEPVVRGLADFLKSKGTGTIVLSFPGSSSVRPTPEAVGAAEARWKDKTPEQKLRWVLEFAAEDLGRLYPEERVARGYDLAAIAGVRPDPAMDLSAEAVQEYQADIMRGVEVVRAAIANESPPPAITAETGHRVEFLTDAWVLSGHPVLRRDGAGFRIDTRREGTGRDVSLGVAELLVRAGHHLRVCPGEDAAGKPCGQLFLRMRRQVFCSAPCAQRARNARKKLRAAGVAPQHDPKKGGSR